MNPTRVPPPETADAHTAAPARLLIVGNCSQNNAISHRVFDPAGISPTVMENHGYPVLILEPQTPDHMPKREILFKQRPDGSIRAYQNNDRKGGVSEMNVIVPPHCVAPTVTTSYAPLTIEATPMNEDARLQVAATIDSGLTFAGTTRQDDKAYHPDGIAPAIAVCRSNHVPLITEPMNEEAKAVYPLNALDGGDVAPTVCAHYHKAGGEDFRPRSEGNPTPHCAIVEATPAEPKIIGYSRDEKGHVVSRHLKDEANTIHTSTGSGNGMGQFVAEPQMLTPLNYGGNHRHVPSDTAAAISASSGGPRQPQYVIEPQTAPADGVCPGSELQPGEPSVKPAPNNAVLIDGVYYRIRKLTPRETGRLMGLSDEEYDIMASAKIPSPTKADPTATRPISKTALYKLHGNSIVTDVLYHIFRTMFLPDQPENATPNQPPQLTLFKF